VKNALSWYKLYAAGACRSIFEEFGRGKNQVGEIGITSRKSGGVEKFFQY